MTKILSWDVGIKNLAYCLIKKEENKFKILEWGRFNLADDAQLCQHILRGGNQCKNNAKIKIYHDQENIFNNGNCMCVCDKHLEAVKPKLIEIEQNSPPKKKNKKTPEKIKKTCNECEEDAIYNIDKTEYCWCEKHKKIAISFDKKIKTKKITVQNCNKKPVQIISENMISKLDQNPAFMDVDEVLIENQPALRNPTMKNVASILYAYFMIRGMTDKQYNSTIREVKFICPSNKLKVNEKNTTSILKKTEKKQVYKMTKKLGIKYCEAIIKENESDILKTHNKKDDMCDAFLQGFQYLFSPIPTEYFDKLKVVGFDDGTKTKKEKKTKQI